MFRPITANQEHEAVDSVKPAESTGRERTQRTKAHTTEERRHSNVIRKPRLTQFCQQVVFTTTAQNHGQNCGVGFLKRKLKWLNSFFMVYAPLINEGDMSYHLKEGHISVSPCSINTIRMLQPKDQNLCFSPVEDRVSLLFCEG